MRSPAFILVIDTILVDAEEKGEGANERLQEDRARTDLDHGNGNGSWPPFAHFWAETDLRRVGMPDPSLDLQPGNPVFATRSPTSLNATPRMESSAPTLGTLRRLTIRCTPMSLRSVDGRTRVGVKGAPCEKPDWC
jgi:hypothetical protein